MCNQSTRSYLFEAASRCIPSCKTAEIFDSLDFHCNRIDSDLENEANLDIMAIENMITQFKDSPIYKSYVVKEKIQELSYPLEQLKAYFAHALNAPDRKCAQLIAKYMKNGLKEIQAIAKFSDARN